MRTLAVVGCALLALAGATAARADTPGDALIHADAARLAGYTGAGVTVALVDTGVDSKNPTLAGAVVAEHCIVSGGGCPNGSDEQDGPGSAQDDQGHGTAMATILTGTAPGVKLVVVKVADRNGRTSPQQIIAGLNWVLTHHPEAKLVSVSLGSDFVFSGPCDNLVSINTVYTQYTTVIDALRANGQTVFASAGNQGSHAAITAPACIHAALAVGAVYSTAFGPYLAPNVCRDAETGPYEIACFSNSSTELDLLAVGAPVDTVGLGSAETLAGTSAATAQATGAAAILLGADPALTPDALESVLKTTGLPITDPRNRITTPLIDVAAALGQLTGKPVPIPPAGGVAAPSTPTLSAPTLPRLALALRPVVFKRGVRTQGLVLADAGTGSLKVLLVSAPPWLAVTPASLLISAGATGTLRLALRPHAGPLTGEIRIATDDPSAGVVSIRVQAKGR
ncbi:MAG: S8 family serine peptidase [Actinobacteria bacterium]|nr:S8 family serine peptidase [Actinomycetota bacterium]